MSSPAIDLSSDEDEPMTNGAGNNTTGLNGDGEATNTGQNDIEMISAIEEEDESAPATGDPPSGEAESGQSGQPTETSTSTAIPEFDNGWRTSRPSLTEKFSFALEHKRLFHDVVFAVGEERVVMSAHKTILAIASPVFEDLFHGPKASDVDESEAIVLGDLEANAFRATLKFMYTGLFDVDLLDAIGVLRAAKMFDLPQLLIKTGEFLIRNLTEQNAITFYQAAEVFDVKNLEESACSFLLNNFWAVAKTEDFLNITFQNLCKFLDMDEINISELEFFNAAMKWAKAQCDKTDQKDTSENLRGVLQEALTMIRFTLMSPKEFALQIVPRFILTPLEVITIFQHLSVEVEERDSLPAVFCKSESRKKLKFNPGTGSQLIDNVKSTRLRVRIRPCDRFTAAVKKDPTYSPGSQSTGRKRTSH